MPNIQCHTCIRKVVGGGNYPSSSGPGKVIEAEAPGLRPNFGGTTACIGGVKLEEASRKLYLGVFDKIGNKEYTLLGSASFAVANIPIGDPVYVWLPM